MNKYILSFLAIAFFSLTTACTTTTSNNGNFANTKQKNFYLHMQNISDDTLSKLESVFPPAKTKLQLIQKVEQSDFFGIFLTKGLRAKGYATLEGQQIIDDDYYPVEYVIKNEKNDNKKYQLILYIGRYAMARFYQVNSKGELEPASAWSLRK